MQDFHTGIKKRSDVHPGKLNWDAATFFFNQGKDPFDAAKQYSESLDRG